jgi:CRISPR-associated protein Csm3
MSAISKKIFIKGVITAQSGLHIGGSNLSMAIGGADAVVVRNPVTQEPYIPGSSLKGKMRSLTERLYDKIGDTKMGQVKNGPYQKPDHVITRLYGMVGTGGNENIPSRVIVRDAHLLPESVQKLGNAPATDMLYTEVKTEVVIDRITSAAMPRQLERVPAGAEFGFEIVLTVYEGDDERDLLDHVIMGLRLLKDDFLGGKGSRGSGQIGISLSSEHFEFKDLEVYQKGLQAKSLTSYKAVLS